MNMNDSALVTNLKGNNYRVGRLPADVQFHLSRRMGPMLAVMGISLFQLHGGLSLDLDDIAPLMGPVSQLMARMEDEDVNYILNTCMNATEREAAGKWAPVVVIKADVKAGGMTFMYADIDMVVMVRLVIESLKHNLANFLPGQSEEQTSPSS